MSFERMAATFPSTQQLLIKVYHKGEVRRFLLDKWTTSLDQLYVEAISIFGLSPTDYVLAHEEKLIASGTSLTRVVEEWKMRGDAPPVLKFNLRQISDQLICEQTECSADESDIANLVARLSGLEEASDAMHLVARVASVLLGAQDRADVCKRLNSHLDSLAADSCFAADDLSEGLDQVVPAQRVSFGAGGGASEEPSRCAPIICDGCFKTIHKLRWVSKAQPNYDLCEACIRARPQDTHLYRRVAHFHPGYLNRRHRALCDFCDARIDGTRYKCRVCPDFDLCESCIERASEEHSGHHFIPLFHPSETEWALRECLNDGIVHRHVYCDHCNRDICGVRYKCLQCANYDLCADCERLTPSVHHPYHTFAKVRHLLSDADEDAVPTAPFTESKTIQTDKTAACQQVGSDPEGGDTAALIGLVDGIAEGGPMGLYDMLPNHEIVQEMPGSFRSGDIPDAEGGSQADLLCQSTQSVDNTSDTHEDKDSVDSPVGTADSFSRASEDSKDERDDPSPRDEPLKHPEGTVDKEDGDSVHEDHPSQPQEEVGSEDGDYDFVEEY